MTDLAASDADVATLFPGPRPAAFAAHRAALEAAINCLERGAVGRGPYRGTSPSALEALTRAVEVLPEHGQPLEDALARVGDLAVAHAVDPTHPSCAAHLHCPPLNAALAADVLVSATNPSLDSWDQAPAATHLEVRLVETLCALAGLPGEADGVLTTGGTQSNLMALLLARDAALARRGRDAAGDGLGSEGANLRILCSEAAHFSVQRSAALLGLGSRAVVTVPTDDQHRLRPEVLDDALDGLERDGLTPMAVVATAGTTDFGSIDPLPAAAAIAQRWGVWLHVDAAYGGGFLLSDRHRALLKGVGQADSVSVDFHKLLWQPIACGALLVRDRAALAPIAVEVAYLNVPDPDEEDDWRKPHLICKSLQTTRRFDALKVLVTFRTLGRRTLGALLDRTLDLAAHAADLIAAAPSLDLVQRPTLNSVVFRCRPCPDEPERSNRLNAAVRTRLLADGAAVVGRTEVGGRTHLKLTFLNPAARPADLAGLVAAITRTADRLDGDPPTPLPGPY